MGKKAKNRVDIVYSTNENFEFEHEDQEEIETRDRHEQELQVQRDRKNRGGKTVTVVSGFIGTTEDLSELGKLLKTRCGVGGVVKDGDILVQGDFKDKIYQLLLKEGYKVKMIGG